MQTWLALGSDIEHVDPAQVLADARPIVRRVHLPVFLPVLLRRATGDVDVDEIAEEKREVGF